jgi:23S rRNA-/tRNA-specific pseudouridylate synthase
MMMKLVNFLATFLLTVITSRHPESKDESSTIPSLRVLFETSHIAVVAKPALVPCHWPERTSKNNNKRLVDHSTAIPILQRAYATFPHQTQIHLVHRLDAATSGCLLLAFSKEAAREAQDALKSTGIKTYYAICRGNGANLREQGRFVASGPVKDSKGIVRSAETEVEVCTSGLLT